MAGLTEKATRTPYGRLRRILLLLGISLFFSAPGCAAKTAPDVTPFDKEIDATPIAQQTYPAHWRSTFLSEPIFGGKIHIVESGIENEQVVILVHGLGQAGWNDWRNVIPAIEGRFHVVAFDLPGFGQSDAGPNLYSPSNYSRLIHWLAGRFTTGKVFVVGHSMGGAISLRYAHDFQDEVARLVLVDVAGILYGTIFLKHIARAKSRKAAKKLSIGFSPFDNVIESIFVPIGAMMESLTETTDSLPDMAQFLLHDEVGKKYFMPDNTEMNAAIALLEENFSQAIREIRVPTHIIWGANDPVAPLRTGKFLAGLMENASLSVLPGIGHVPMKEAPDRFNEVLIKKLAEESLPPEPDRPKPSDESEDYVCEDRKEVTLTGTYRGIFVNHCADFHMNNVNAKSITLLKSTITMENVRVVSQGTALNVEGSVVEGTLVLLEGEQALKVSGSQIDFAGASLIGRSEGIEIKRGSKLYFSVSAALIGERAYYFHGVYKAKNTFILGTLAPE